MKCINENCPCGLYNCRSEYNCDYYYDDYLKDCPSFISKLEKKIWRAEKSRHFYYIGQNGEILCEIEYYDQFCNQLYDFENYFKTEREAKESIHYKMFNKELQ